MVRHRDGSAHGFRHVGPQFRLSPLVTEPFDPLEVFQRVREVFGQCAGHAARKQNVRVVTCRIECFGQGGDGIRPAALIQGIQPFHIRRYGFQWDGGN